jgi:hypothetical protein
VGPDCRRHRGDAAHRGRPPPYDPELIELIGQLSTRSTAFRARWAANDVRAHRGGTKIFHPLIGEVTLPFENLHVDAVAGQVLTVFTPPPGTPEADAIRLLASWNADNEQNTNQTTGIRHQRPDTQPLTFCPYRDEIAAVISGSWPPGADFRSVTCKLSQLGPAS